MANRSTKTYQSENSPARTLEHAAATLRERIKTRDQEQLLEATVQELEIQRRLSSPISEMNEIGRAAMDYLQELRQTPAAQLYFATTQGDRVILLWEEAAAFIGAYPHSEMETRRLRVDLCDVRKQCVESQLPDGGYVTANENGVMETHLCKDGNSREFETAAGPYAKKHYEIGERAATVYLGEHVQSTGGLGSFKKRLVDALVEEMEGIELN